jgi:hypothetical protein
MSGWHVKPRRFREDAGSEFASTRLAVLLTLHRFGGPMTSDEIWDEVATYGSHDRRRSTILACLSALCRDGLLESTGGFERSWYGPGRTNYFDLAVPVWEAILHEEYGRISKPAKAPPRGVVRRRRRR